MTNLPVHSYEHQSFPPLLRSVDRYQLPNNREEVLLRSFVNRRILNNHRRLLRALFLSGRVRNGLLHWNNFIIALEEVSLESYGVSLQPGEWVDTYWHVHGRDLIELVAYGWQTSYSKAVEMIADHLAVPTGNELHTHEGKVPGWAQERNPLHPFFENTLLGSVPASFAYRNRMGTISAVGRTVISSTGEVFTVFKIILKHQKTGRCYVAEAFPDKPLHLYHLDLIAVNPGAPVVLCLDEGEADRSQHQGVVFSAVPGGPDNLLDADFSCLKGRKVYVHLRRQDVCRGRLIERRLRDAGVHEAFFSVNNGNAPHFSKLEVLADQLGVEFVQISDSLTSSARLAPQDLKTFLANLISARGWILEWIIPEQGLVMIHAPRGVGKTHIALGIAYACATGSQFLRWHAPMARSVLYLDGEMSASDLQERLKAIAPNVKDDTAANLRVLNPDLLDQPMPDLATEEGQSAVEPLLAGVDLVIVDNLATLCRSGNENGGESWLAIQGWLLDLRRRGISVLLIHHSGKNGGQRGTSRREDVLDTVIRLQRPTDYNASQGARFEVHLCLTSAPLGHIEVFA